MSEDEKLRAILICRDRVQVREQERNEAQACARIVEEKVAALTAENDRLARENIHLRDQNDRLAVEIARLSAQNERLAADLAWLRAQPAPETARAHTEPKKDLKTVNDELQSLLGQISGPSFAPNTEFREIAAQFRALADTVQAGRDEWVIVTAQRAQCLSALSQGRGFWR